MDVKDAKTRLQEYLQSNRLALPEYTLIEVGGEAHARHFVIECSVASLEGPTLGEGSSRRRAEQQAAQKALDLILND